MGDPAGRDDDVVLTIPDPSLVALIDDVHGCADELSELLALLGYRQAEPWPEFIAGRA